MRLGFAVAAHVDADVLLLDEVFAVGDEAFQRKCIGGSSSSSARRHDRLRLARRVGGREAVRTRDHAARGRGRVRRRDADALTEYHRLLADERDPAERAGGLSEWGAARPGSSSRAARRRRRGTRPVRVRGAVLAAADARGVARRCRRRASRSSSATRPTVCWRGAASTPRRSAGRRRRRGRGSLRRRLAPAGPRPLPLRALAREPRLGSRLPPRSRTWPASRSTLREASEGRCCSTEPGRERKSPPPQK